MRRMLRLLPRRTRPTRPCSNTPEAGSGVAATHGPEQPECQQQLKESVAARAAAALSDERGAGVLMSALYSPFACCQQ